MDFYIGNNEQEYSLNVEADQKKKIEADYSRNNLLTDFGKSMLSSDYLMAGEDYQDRFMNVAIWGSDDLVHAKRLYDYMSKLWFMPATPVLSNGGTDRGLPISCFLNESEDSLESIKYTWDENIELASKGGGIGTYWGNVRSIGEKVKERGKTSGIMPFIKIQDSLALGISQGSLRRGAAAAYLNISHPEIEEFVEMRRSTGADPNRRSTYLHHGVVITDDFMIAVEKDLKWDLISPKTKEVVNTISARDLWIRILTARVEMGEPYILFYDTVNALKPEFQKKLNLDIKTSNLCSEITLPTGRDHLGNMRTAVCCLSSLNLEKYFEWKDDKNFIVDIMRFLDNVIQAFINNAPSERKRIYLKMKKDMNIDEVKNKEACLILEKTIENTVEGMMDRAIYSASRERSVGLGVMGFHSFLQMNNIPFESVMAKSWNLRIFKYIKSEVDKASHLLALERGSCPDAIDGGNYKERFSNKTSIAPTASISVICGQTSPGIEPFITNSFVEKRKNGSFNVKNKYLQQVLEKHEKNNDAVWESITVNLGSVQHLDFLTKEEKDVFKTAFEIDQRWIIELSADRTPYIDQAQSVNIFVHSDIHKINLHNIHFKAWKDGLKSLYYCRSLSIARAQNVSSNALLDSRKKSSEIIDIDECLSCQ